MAAGKKPNLAAIYRREKNKKWEDMLAYQLALYGLGHYFKREFVIKETGRRFLWDFADPVNKVAIEFQGAIWIPGAGHSGGTGLRRDHAKANAAAFWRWHVFYFDDRAITSYKAIELIKAYYAKYVFGGNDHPEPEQDVSG